MPMKRMKGVRSTTDNSRTPQKKTTFRSQKRNEVARHHDKHVFVINRGIAALRLPVVGTATIAGDVIFSCRQRQRIFTPI